MFAHGDVTGNSGGTRFIDFNSFDLTTNNFTITGDGPPMASSGYALLQ